MLHHYRDITDKLGRPEWWDEVGAPRYCKFSPTETNNIYCDEVALLEIACQNCGVIEFWTKEHMDWKRVPELEIEL